MFGNVMTQAMELDSRERLRQIIAEKSFRLGEFTLASGKKSDVFFDLKPTMLDPGLCCQFSLSYILPSCTTRAASSADNAGPVAKLVITNAAAETNCAAVLWNCMNSPP